MSAPRPLALLIALAGLAGCGDEPPLPGPDNAAAPAPAANQAAAAPSDETGRLEAQARTALAALLPNAATVPLLGVHRGVGGAVCGEVGTAAGFRGFVVPPQGRAAIARSQGLDLDDIDDPYPSLYIRWCASGAELIALQPQLEGAAAVPEGSEAGNAAAPVEAAPPAAEPAPRAAPPPRRPPGEPTGRFSDAVLRPDER